jgi:hypothetical protein
MIPTGPLRAKARTVFIRALAVHTPAIRELRSRRLAATARAAERERAIKATRRFLPNPADALEQAAAEHLF